MPDIEASLSHRRDVVHQAVHRRRRNVAVLALIGLLQLGADPGCNDRNHSRQGWRHSRAGFESTAFEGVDDASSRQLPQRSGQLECFGQAHAMCGKSEARMGQGRLRHVEAVHGAGRCARVAGIHDPGCRSTFEPRQQCGRLTVELDDLDGLGPLLAQQPHDPASRRVLAPIGIADTQDDAMWMLSCQLSPPVDFETQEVRCARDAGIVITHGLLAAAT